MLIHGSIRYIQASFESEDELERVVVSNYEHIFGPAAIYLHRGLISTPDGASTIPDGFVFDLAGRQWFIVEAELAKHSVWGHIAPQVAKQITAALKPDSKRYLVERVVSLFREDERAREKFEDEGIEEIDIRKVLDEILTGQPILGMPIDSVSNDLREWASTSVKIEVKLWLVRKHVELGNAANVVYEIPEEYRPVLDTAEDTEAVETRSIATYDVSLGDLIAAGILRSHEKLYMSYKRRHELAERITFEAEVLENGDLSVEGQVFSSPSYAAIFCINKAGSSRTTVNGWTSWKCSDGRFLAELRTEFQQRGKTA